MPKNNGFVYPLTVTSDGKSLMYIACDQVTGMQYDVVVCPVIQLTEMIRNVDNNSTLIKLKFHNGINETEFQMPYDKVTNKDLINTLMKNSFIVEDMYAPELCSYVTNLVRNFPTKNIQYLHSSLGYHHNNSLGAMAYFADKSYNATIQSTLANNTNGLFGPNGDIKIYDSMLKKEVLPNPKLQLAFVLGFVAPIVPLLSSKTSVDVIISNFSGLSSTGKTTSLSLMASVWGSGAVTNQGIIKTFFATNNSLLSNLTNNMGFPVLFDDYETGNENAYGLTSLLYQIAQGESKGRCDVDGGMRPTYSWKTFVALSGETSIFERTIKKQGLHGRVLEFNDFAWTKSKQNSENITSVTRTNYGFYGPQFVQKLATLPIETLESKYDSAYATVIGKITSSNGIEARMVSKIAYIYLTAQLVRELLDIKIDTNAVLDLLVSNEKESRITRDVYAEALDTIKELITKNLSGIQCVRHLEKGYTGRLIGKKEINRHTGATEISLLTTVVDEELERKGFNDRLKILKHLADQNYLERSNDRLFRMITIGYLSQKCYKFIFHDYVESTRQIVCSGQPAPECETHYDDEEAIDEIFDEDNNQ